MKTKIIYLMYICFILILTAYFSLSIIQDKNIPSGEFISPLYMNASAIANENQSIVIYWNNLIKSWEEHRMSIPEEKRRRKELTFNDNGNIQEYYTNKSNSTFRIIALGDSFTAGSWVSDNDSYPKQLEKKLNQINISTRVEVLKLIGGAGAGLLEKVKIFENNGLKYNPDMVILQFYIDDFEDSEQIRERANEIWNMYKNGSFKFPSTVEEKIKELNASEADISTIMFYMAKNEFRYYAQQKGIDKVLKENIETPLLELIDFCNKQNIDLIIIGLDLDADDMSIKERELLNNLSDKHKIPFLDFTSYFPLDKNSELRLPDIHLNEKGYDLLSTKVFEFLIQSNKIRIK
jgi:lysophospholipase L1-like esterase